MSKIQKKEIFNVDKAIEEISDPFRGYEPIEAENPKEASAFLEKIEYDLSSGSTWKNKYNAINRLISLLKGGIHYYPGGDLKQLAPLIANVVIDLRAVVVRSSAILVSAAARSIGEEFAEATFTIFPSLLKQVLSKNPAISNYCHLALLEIAKYVFSKQVAHLFISYYTSSVTFYRQIAVEACHIIYETWPLRVSSSLSKEINIACEKLSNDPDKIIREIAREAIIKSRDSTPRKRKTPSTLKYSPTVSERRPLSPITQRSNLYLSCGKESPTEIEYSPKYRYQKPQNNDEEYDLMSDIQPYNLSFSTQSTESPPISPPVKLKKGSSIKNEKESDIRSGSKSENAPPSNIKQETEKGEKSSVKHLELSKSKKELTIVDYMPPQNKKEANHFRILLENQVESGYLSIFTDEKLLVSSVLYSAQQVPKLDLWKNIIQALIQQFQESFYPYTITLMSIFHFDEWIIELLSNFYSIQQIAESFVTGRRQKMNDAYNFFVTVYKTQNYQIEVNEKMRNLFGVLIRSNPRNEDTKYLKIALEQSQLGPSVDNITSRLVDHLQKNEPWDDDLKILEETFDGSKQMASKIERRFGNDLPQMIAKGTDFQRELAMEFIRDCCTKLKMVSFGRCLQPLLALMLDKNIKNERLAYDCLAKMMSDVKTLAASISILKNEKRCEDIMINAFLAYFTDAPPQRLLPLQNILVPELLPYMGSKDEDIRKKTVLVFAEFKRKIPKEFGRFMNKKFTPTQRRIVEMTVGKGHQKR